MKSALVWLLVLAGGYLAYRVWFAPSEETSGPAAAGSKPDPAEPGPQPRLEIPKELPPVQGGAAGVAEEERRQAELRGDEAAARAAEEEILAGDRAGESARRILFDRGMAEREAYEKLGRTPEGMKRANEARRILTEALFAGSPAPAEQEKLREILRKLAQDVVFGPRAVEGVHFVYTPKSGDSFDQLCRSVFPKQGAKAGFGLILDVNRMKDARALRAGEAIRVPLGEPRIVAVKSEFRLYYLLDGRFVRDFPMGIGRDDLTPEGEFVIDGKQKEPDWWPRPGEKIPFGDPRNILGTRWMSFRDTPECQGFGIHGTADPASIGKAESSGCIRMRTEDVERLFDWTPLGLAVTIRR